MASDGELFEEMFGELVEAVFTGDCRRAEAKLEQMCSCGLLSDEIMRAKRRAWPALRPALRLTQADLFPKPGARPGDFLDELERKAC